MVIGPSILKLKLTQDLGVRAWAVILGLGHEIVKQTVRLAALKIARTFHLVRNDSTLMRLSSVVNMLMTHGHKMSLN